MILKNTLKQYKFLLPVYLTLLIILLSKCIDPFETGATTGRNLLTIDGSLVKNKEIQKVVITRSAEIGVDTIDYVSNCSIYVEDELQNKEYYTETSKGIYEAEIDNAYMVLNRKYKLVVETNEGGHYESAYETLYNCPPVDSIYTSVEKVYSYQAGGKENALQFYIDLRAKDSDPRYYRWTIEEDWIYKVPFYFQGTWDGKSLITSYKIYDSLQTCYSHTNATGLYSSNTKSLLVNEKKKIPLNYVFEGSIKVSTRYSILVSQYSLTENAYAYWQQKKDEIEGSDGLYTSQPTQPRSNFKNLSNEDEIVLGYFWTGSMTQKRIFYNQRFGYDTYFSCPVDTLGSGTLNPDSLVTYDRDFIIYMFIRTSDTGTDYYITSYDECFDCRKHGGVIKKPDFWND